MGYAAQNILPVFFEPSHVVGWSCGYSGVFYIGSLKNNLTRDK